ncbi:MAG: hemerythrin domain-containing protein, partial [Deltaproteobacteria bacterium]|nr:hemerythrin domain-containing protein [Deltaproteobacteria bacterium]
MSKRSSTGKKLQQALRFEDEKFEFSARGPRAKASKDDDALTGIIETLYSEHAYISVLLDRLEREADKLTPGKVPDYALLLEMVDYLTHYPDQYHHPREDMLFEGLMRSDGKLEARVKRLQREHTSLHTYNDELFGELSDIARGRPVDRPALQRRLRRYTKGYRQHLEYESREIFPRAKGTLSPGELGKLDRKTRFIDDPIFGGMLQQRYHRLGRDLRSTLGGFQSELIAREISAVESIIERVSELADSATEFREGFSGSLASSLQDRVDRLKALLGLAPRPSWQARVMNTCTRVIMKPMMRFG